MNRPIYMPVVAGRELREQAIYRTQLEALGDPWSVWGMNSKIAAKLGGTGGQFGRESLRRQAAARLETLRALS